MEGKVNAGVAMDSSPAVAEREERAVGLRPPGSTEVGSRRSVAVAVPVSGASVVGVAAGCTAGGGPGVPPGMVR